MEAGTSLQLLSSDDDGAEFAALRGEEWDRIRVDARTVATEVLDAG